MMIAERSVSDHVTCSHRNDIFIILMNSKNISELITLSMDREISENMHSHKIYKTASWNLRSIFFVEFWSPGYSVKGNCIAVMEHHFTATECHLPYGITQWSHMAQVTQVNAPRLHPSQSGRYSIYLPRRDRRLSWPRWLVTYRDGLPTRRRSPIQVLTGPGVD